ncbi:MAG: hypothetical protein EP339_08590 [Gammaproteobacteria bacterium]|uniref:Uncharacterized protein n=1 Tax=Marinobacter nitratireducens TaxID=1137280 RepID=A0A072NE86_9GAMM|nr:hypothetical protein [Marinobacter nitratireducens]KEF31410.1 hypothetical protein D777_01759 [Marinobacter nitratireducens]TNE75835.1 MAG: hypothetical protein EP339_08590 [Gammaproteobacteria bacterium]TNF00566.1 MAG: hypothetical protein EP328_01225 [Gammaproteobacteria bacterium]
MIQNRTATVNPLPSSILHNGADVRSQYTRAAAAQVGQFISRKLRSWNRKAETVAQDLTQMQGGH